MNSFDPIPKPEEFSLEEAKTMSSISNKVDIIKNFDYTSSRQAVLDLLEICVIAENVGKFQVDDRKLRFVRNKNN
jgi:hypothetical protein